jgi:hypothetical protein
MPREAEVLEIHGGVEPRFAWANYDLHQQDEWKYRFVN